MRTFILEIHSRPGATPHIYTAQFRDDERAREFAAARLAEDAKIDLIAISEDGRELARIARLSDRTEVS